ncbi:MAG: preprotein translocase subunit SecG [Roseovarius sp.]|nr:preprotein translocase subunit SecG [Roseovarius sp.]MCY4209283.1 preprotein translocase subunit SecG [Roseovarius sp.]MCY4317500.1 preprotein translocase subunit SecG [Roseovarius sp.]
MQNVVLLIHLLLTLSLIGIVLMQRSEGGGLGIGGGGNVMTGRSAATALGKATWALGIGLFATSLILTVIAAQNSSGASVLDRIVDSPAKVESDVSDLPDAGDGLLPPSADDNAPLTPTAD